MVPKPAPTPGDSSWFVRDRFGLFIHWGIYALPARHEWVKSREKLTDEAYRKYFERFDPDLYDPSAWAAEAANAGMKYFVVTTKHHDGFCLWDSKLTDYKATRTPHGRDLLKSMVDAFRERGLRVGFYHSLLDWHHPQFPVDCHHPLQEDEAARDSHRDVRKYAEYLHGQTRELLTQFGKIDILWFDFSYPNRKTDGLPGKGREAWQSEKLYELVRELQPQVMLNNRLDLESGFDFVTPEQVQPQGRVELNGQPVVWEACQTFSGSWGYHRDESSWKSTDQLLRMLIDTVSKDGNLLLNVGPTGRGEFDERALERLRGIGAWMRRNGRSIYGCGASAFQPPADCRYTQNGNRLYVHVFAWPFARQQLQLPGLRGKVAYAQLLHDASEVLIEEPRHHAHSSGMSLGGDPEAVVLKLPTQPPPVAVPTIELFLKEE